MQEVPNTLNHTPASTATFIGLKAYEESDAAKFFGRDEEIKKLCQLIRTNVLTIVFGKSGTGKTSLLNAGVFPKLREDNCLPFRIRLEFQESSPALMTQIMLVLKTQIATYGFKIADVNSSETLWEFFHREDLWKIVTPVLIFDQFEEIFTLALKQPNRSKELDELITELSDLIENTIPEKLKDQYLANNNKIDFNYKQQEAKIIFSFREDFLPEMESITARIPSVKHSRFRLMPMNGKQANEVVTKTWGQAIDPIEARKIVFYLTNETESDQEDNENVFGKFNLLEIEPSLLSQVCAYLDKERIKENLPKISAEFLNKYPKGIILKSIYHSALQEIDQSVHEAKDVAAHVSGDQVKIFVEERLITEEGYRSRLSSKEVDSDINQGIEVLKKKYFIREDGKTIELTHDVMATIVKNDRDERRTKQAVHEANKKATKKALLIIAIAAIFGLGLWGWAEMKRQEVVVKTEILEKEIRIETIKRDTLIQINHRLDTYRVIKNNFIVSKEKVFIRDSILIPGKNIVDSSSILSLNNSLGNLQEKYNLIASLIAQKDNELNRLTNEISQLKSELDSNEDLAAFRGKLLGECEFKLKSKPREEIQPKDPKKIEQAYRMYISHVDRVFENYNLLRLNYNDPVVREDLILAIQAYKKNREVLMNSLLEK